MSISFDELEDRDIISIHIYTRASSRDHADVIHCKNTTDCCYYKNSSCLQSRIFNSLPCPYGYVTHIEGYTPRSKKYREWNKCISSHPAYSFLKNSFYDIRFGIVNDYYHFNVSHAGLDKKHYIFEPGMELSDEAWATNHQFFIKKEHCTINFLYKLFSLRPRDLFNNKIIKAYQEEVIPSVKAEIKSKAPELYSEYIEKYSGVNWIMNYIGMRAYLGTLKPGCSIRTRSGVFTLSEDRKTLSCMDLDLSFFNYAGLDLSLLPVQTSSIRIKIDVTKDMLIKINDNDIVDKHTVLV